MPRAQTDDGVGLSYGVRGEGPRNLLFMHGWAGSGDYFNGLIDHLNLSQVRAITYDMRGHGDAAKFVELLEPYMTAPVDPEVLERFGQNAARAPLADLERTMNLVTSVSFADRVGALEMPILVIAGANDVLLPPDLLKGMADGLKNARLEIIDCGHEIPIEKPKDLAERIETFLASLQSSH